MNGHRKLVVAAMAGASALIWAAPALAQDSGASADDDEIIVTAQRRDEKSLDVPVTVNTLSAAAIETANVQDLSDIAKVTPGLRFDFASGYSQPTIRGVGTSVTSSGAVGNVGIYIDGFYSPNPIVSDFQLLKLRSIQVLKGPQGTLFGRNTTGGAILVQTADPSTDSSGEARISYGRYNEVRGQAYATFGLAENVAMDVEGSYSRGDGFLTNISNNQRVGKYENWSTRVGLKADLGNVSVLLRYIHSEVDDPTSVLTGSYRDLDTTPGQVYVNPVLGGAPVPFRINQGAPFFATPGEITFNPDQVASGSAANDQQFFRSKSNIVQATIKADLGFANLTSYTQYRKEDADSRIEGDHSGTEVFDIGLPNDNSTFTQELLLTSKAGSRLQWTGGLFYVRNRDTYRVYFDYLPAFGINGRCCEFGSSSVSESFAAYFDATYEISPKFFITAGGRYAYDKQSNVYSIAAFVAPPANTPSQAEYDQVNGSHFTPRVVLRYKPSDEASLYASWSRGYKAAFLDLGGGLQPNVNDAVSPEKIDAYEFGVKYDNRRISFEGAFFYYDYKDLQVSLYQSARAVIINAATSKVYGIDAQARFNITDKFSVNVGGTWLHARYKRFNNAPVYTPCLMIPLSDPNSACYADPNSPIFAQSFPITGTLLTDSPMQRSPDFTGNIGARYKTDLGGGELTLSGNLYYTSKFYFGPSGVQFPQKGYEVLSLRAQWVDPSDHFMVAVFGDNVTNNRYMTGVQYTNNGIGANWSKPATWGIELGAKF
ncbi:MAG: TonB-dependent receptor [Novosphingobium sp.]